LNVFLFFFSSRRRHTRFSRDWSSDVCSSDLVASSFRPDQEALRGARLAAGAAGLAVRGTEGLTTTVLTLAGAAAFLATAGLAARSEERRVGKEGSARGCLHGSEQGRE